jgi:eukaryotic-like serine/threonine-protein kinase
MSLCGKCHRDAPDGALFCSFCGAAITPATSAGDTVDPLIGQTVNGKYFIHQLLGRGGMGDVYKATHLTLDRPVALKLLKKLFHSDPSLVQRFHREARAASRLNHPNSITIIDFGQTDDGALFMAMEFLAGRPLERVVSDEHPLPEWRVVHMGAQILAALGEAHSLGIIHRDLKPANVMVEPRRDEPDFVKVLDFGIAKLNEPGGGGAGLTQAGIVCGTPGYMSPEQVRGEELDARSDLYAVGVILYEMLTGVLPFESDTPMGLVTKHLVEDPPPLGVRAPGVVVSPALEGIIMRALARDRTHRFASADDMRAHLLACARATPAPVRPTPAPSSRTIIFDPGSLPPAPPRPQTGPRTGPGVAGQPAGAPQTGAGVARPQTEGAAVGGQVPQPASGDWPVQAPPKTPAPRTATPPAATPAPTMAAMSTPAPATPAVSVGPRTPAPARKATASAPVVRHEMDDEGDEESAAAPSAARSKTPVIAGAAVAGVLVVALVAWGLTRGGSKGDPAPAAAPATVARPSPAPPVPAPPAAAPAVPLPPPPVVAQPVPATTPAPLPSAPVASAPASSAPPPARPAAAVEPPAPAVTPQPAPRAAAPAARKGIRQVGGDLNSIKTPAAATGEGVLTILATPWAEVEIDGKEIGETPREVRLGAGTYRVRASHPALGTRERSVTVEAGKRQTWNLTFAN